MEIPNYGPDMYSINPLLPCSEFLPDGEPHIFGDRIYVYGSHDLYESGEMCQGDYVCYSADASNPVKWKYEGTIYKREQDPFVKKQLDSGKATMFNSNLFAPDVVAVNDKYYLYYGVGMSGSGFGVAVADSPIGPYTYIGRVRYPESEKKQNWKDCYDGIEDGDMAFGNGVPPFKLKPGRGFGMHVKHYPYDPGVIFDNGRLFLYYGLAFCRVVELDINDMRTVLMNEKTGRYESEVLVPSFLPTSEKMMKKRNTGGIGMVNAPSIRKIDGQFCLTYYAMGPNHTNAMCYALADSPFGPFTYGGILVSLGNASYMDQTEPTDYVGNTHGGMVEVKGVWYSLYHRQTGNRSCGRQVCATTLQRTANGGFQHAEYTSLGFSNQSLPAYYCWPAYMACYFTDANGHTKRNSNAPYIALKEYAGGERDEHSGKEMLQVITNLTNRSVVGIKHFDFGSEAQVNATIVLTMMASCNGTVEVCIDEPNPQNCVAKVQIVGENIWKTYSGLMESISGSHAIYFIFCCKEKTLGDMSLFEINKNIFEKYAV